MNPTIRTATKDDAVLIADISHQTFYDTFALENSKEDMEKFLTEQFTKGRLMLEVGTPENNFLLAYVNGSIAGYAKLRDAKVPVELRTVPSLEIARLYVLNDFLGKGVGAALMKACVDAAAANGKKVIWLGVWEKNKRAIDFYTRWGFQKFSECDFLLGDDLQKDWLMKKELITDDK
jgi:ribosomal protein S18 acetylase RimI-like enzyme